MKSKLIEQIDILEKAQKEALISCRYDLIVGFSEMIFKCQEQLEIYK